MRARKQEVEELRAGLADARRQIAGLESELRAARTADPLTGLPLLDELDRRLGPEIERSRRHGSPLTVAVIDVDGFRAINAHHGRKAGDKVLAAVGKLLAEQVRASDVVSRSGADEFVAMLPETRAEEAMQAFDRIFLALEALHVGEIESATVSVGVAQWERGMTSEQLLAKAGTRVDVARSLGGGRAAASDAADTADGDKPRAQGDVIAALAEALLERDRYTGEHSESVVDLVESVARGLALGAAEVDQIKAAALLHDIGKVAIPDDVLNKPGPLDDDEWKVMREHPAIGERILRAIPGMGPIARIVRHEHERFDGAGYPDGIAGDQIPIGARIILACDAYHAMTSDRPYRKGMSHAEAVRELSEHAGTQFDPSVTEILIGTLYGRRQSGGGRTEVETSAGAAA
ncbi:MAG TPA: diguanylate cyclase [Thermoleophilaceae bacterium]|nr:diguanylate cyclase [Thermoleophilaceae bacterium]